MRPCGHHFEGADDDELSRLCREHVDAEHPEMRRSDEQLRERITADAYGAAPGLMPSASIDVPVGLVNPLAARRVCKPRGLLTRTSRPRAAERLARLAKRPPPNASRA